MLNNNKKNDIHILSTDIEMVGRSLIITEHSQLVLTIRRSSLQLSCARPGQYPQTIKINIF